MTFDWDQHPEAEEELAEMAEWYERREPGVGHELVHATQEAVESTLDPTIEWGFYRDRRSDPQLYARSIAGFPIDLIYLRTGTTIFVVAYAPERRRPGYWLHRLYD